MARLVQAIADDEFDKTKLAAEADAAADAAAAGEEMRRGDEER